MSYKGKEPHRYDRNSRSWKEGAFRNQRGKLATEADRELLERRETNYHCIPRNV